MLDINILAEALKESREKANINRLVLQIHREGIELIDFLQSIDDIGQPTRWHLTWLLSHYVEQQPDIGAKCIRQIWENLQACEYAGMQRDYWRSLSFVSIPEDLSAEVFDHAQRVFMSERYAIAVRAHAMFVAMNIARPYPELLEELDLVFTPIQSEGSSAGLRARAKNLRKEIVRLKKKNKRESPA